MLYTNISHGNPHVACMSFDKVLNARKHHEMYQRNTCIANTSFFL